MLVKNVAAVPGRGADLRRHEGRRSRPTSSTPAARSSIRPATGYLDAASLDRERRDREQHGRAAAHRRTRLPCVDRVPPADPAPASIRTRTPPNAGLPAFVIATSVPVMQKHVRRRQLPRHARELALSHVRRLARAAVRWNYLAARGVPRADRRSRASSCDARSRPRRAARSTKAASIFASPSDAGYQSLLGWAQAEHGPRGDHRDRERPAGLHLLRAHGAADPREEGLHDGAVPLGVDVPRLPPPRRLGRAASRSRPRRRTTSSRSRSSRSRATTSNASRIVRKNLYRPKLQRRPRTASASRTAAARSSRTSGPAPRPPARSATRTCPRTTTTTATSTRSPRTASSASGTSASAPARRRSRRSRAIVYVKRPPARRRSARRTSTCTRPARSSTSLDATLDAAGNVTTSGDTDIVDRRLRRSTGDRRHSPTRRLVGRQEDRVRRARERDRAASRSTR